MSAAHRVAVLPGDDAAPEAVDATLTVLRAMELPVEWVVLPSGEQLVEMDRASRERYVREAVDSCATALFGATSGKTGGIGYLRWGKRTYANVRPVRWRPGYPSPLRDPEGIDYVVVRENLEDVYTGLEGDLAELRESGLRLRTYVSLFGGADHLEDEGRYAIKLFTRTNVEQVARFALALARQRGRRLTVGAKWNILPATDGFFRDTVRQVATEYPDVQVEEYLADDLARRIVQSPHELDVVLLPNLYGDILSDEAAGTIGGLGLSPSGCYGDDYAYFEPVHGTAPDIAGRGVINPIATMLSAAMLLRHLGLAEASERLDAAVDAAVRDAEHLTPDMGGTSSTTQFAGVVRDRL